MIKATTIYRTIVIIAICLFSFTVFTSTNNPPAANAGDPGNGTCTSCHGGTAITSGAAWSSIDLTGLPAGGYVPGTTYTLTYSGNSAATSKNGFQLTSLTPTNTMAGTLAAGSGTSIQTSAAKSYISQNGNTSGSWTFSWTAPASGTGTVTFYTAFNGSNANSATSGDLIYNKTFTLNQASGNLPTAVITPSSTSICLGDTLYLEGSGINNPTTYNWQFVNNTPGTATGKNVFVVYSTLGSKTIRLTTSNVDGSSPQTSINITVKAKPTASITTPNGLNICGNDSIQLLANAGTGLTYLWTPGNFTTQSINVADSFNYRVRVTNAGGCSVNSNFVKPTKNAYPQSILFTSKDTICKNDSVVFDLSGGGFLAEYFVNDTFASQSIAYIFKRNQAGTYKITPKITKNGCTNVLPNKFISIQEQAPAPTVLCGNSTVSSMQFTWEKVGNHNNYEVSTNNGDTWSDANGLDQLSHTVSNLQPNSNVSILVRVKSAGPCGSGLSGSKSCVNNGCTPINITLNYDKNVCVNPASSSGKATSVELKSVSNSAYLVQFEFENNVSTFSRNTIFNLNARVGLNAVRIKVKDSSNNICPIVDTTITITGNSIPAKPILSLDKQSGVYCKDDNIILTTTKASSNVLLSVFQTQPNRKLLNETYSNAGNFNLKTKLASVNNKIIGIVTDTLSSCADSSTEITIIENPKPKASFTFEYVQSDTNKVNKNKVLFTNSSTDTTNNLWFFGDSSNSTSILNNPSFIYKKAGSYTVKLIVKNISNCADTASNLITILNTSVQSFTDIADIKIYPNPAKDFVHIELSDVTKNIGISVIDLNGKIHYQSVSSKSINIPVQEYKSGVYLIKLELNEKTYYTRFIKN